MATPQGGARTSGQYMKPYFLMLLIGTIVAFSGFVRRGQAGEREAGGVPTVVSAGAPAAERTPSHRRLP